MHDSWSLAEHKKSSSSFTCYNVTNKVTINRTPCYTTCDVETFVGQAMHVHVEKLLQGVPGIECKKDKLFCIDDCMIVSLRKCILKHVLATQILIIQYSSIIIINRS